MDEIGTDMNYFTLHLNGAPAQTYILDRVESKRARTGNEQKVTIQMRVFRYSFLTYYYSFIMLTNVQLKLFHQPIELFHLLNSSYYY